MQELLEDHGVGVKLGGRSASDLTVPPKAIRRLVSSLDRAQAKGALTHRDCSCVCLITAATGVAITRLLRYDSPTRPGWGWFGRWVWRMRWRRLLKDILEDRGWPTRRGSPSATRADPLPRW